MGSEPMARDSVLHDCAMTVGRGGGQPGAPDCVRHPAIAGARDDTRRRGARDNTRDTIQVVLCVHIVRATGRYGRSGTRWTDMTPASPG
jgi:hypothetical protein